MSFAASDLAQEARAACTNVVRRLRRLSLSRWSPAPDPATTLTVLSASEKALLRRFVAAGTPRIRVPSPTIAFGLELADIVSIHRLPHAPADPFEVAVHAWAWECLTRRPELVDLPAPGGR